MVSACGPTSQRAMFTGSPHHMRLRAAMHAAGGKRAAAGSRLVLSHHDYEGTPDLQTLQGILQRMADAGADVPKVACVANDVADSARMLRLIAESPSARPQGSWGMSCTRASEGLLWPSATCPGLAMPWVALAWAQYAASCCPFLRCRFLPA